MSKRINWQANPDFYGWYAPTCEDQHEPTNNRSTPCEDRDTPKDQRFINHSKVTKHG